MIMSHPQIIQGGMGAGVSDWRLARAVSQTGQLGVVSGTAPATILVRRLQTGDTDGRMRHALEQFPVPGIAAKVMADYFIPRAIPGVLDQLARGEGVQLKMDIEGGRAGEEFYSKFDPAVFCGGTAPLLKRPYFLGIVASATLAMTLARKSNGRVDGFVVEC